MTMLTDDEIWKNDAIMAANSGYGANFDTLRELARAIITAYQAKLLAEVGMPEYKYIDRHDVPKEGMCVYTQDQLQQYAAACVAKALHTPSNAEVSDPSTRPPC